MILVEKTLDRRAVLAGAVGLLLAARCRARGDFGQQIAVLEAALAGRIGVSALDTGTGARLAHRGRERFAMCSSFKWLLVTAILARCERGESSLDQLIRYSDQDLLGIAPITRAHARSGHLTIAELCAAAVKFSDNTAANLLLREVGGPKGLTHFLRTIGDPVTRLDRTELALNSNIPGDPRDTTMPDAMIETMRSVLLGDVLKPPAREQLIQWLRASTTGLGRLRGGLPTSWVVGDKTGTGFKGPCNDNAIAWPPGRAPILIVTYVDAPGATDAQREAPHARIAALIASEFVG